MYSVIEKKSIEGLMFYLLLLLMMIYDSGMLTVLKGIHRDGNGSLYLLYIIIILGGVLLIKYIFKNSLYIYIKNLYFLIFLIVYYLIYLLFTRFSVTRSIVQFLCPLMIFYLISMFRGGNKTFRSVLDYTSDITFILSITSLILYLLGPIGGIINGKEVLFRNNSQWNSAISYYHLLYFNKAQLADFLGHRFIRNTSIFMEAPGFAFPLILSLHWELNMKDKKNINNLRIIIITIAAITTFSTKCFLYGFFSYAWFLLVRFEDKSGIFRKLKKYVIPFVVFLGVIGSLYLLYDKFNASYGRGSMLRRFDDIYAAFFTWLDNIAFGVGYRNNDALFSNFMFSEAVGSSTAGILNILAYGGIYMFFIYVFSLTYLYKRYPVKTDIQGWMLLLFLFFATSSMQYSLFTLMILGIGCSLFLGKKEEFSGII